MSEQATPFNAPDEEKVSSRLRPFSPQPFGRYTLVLPLAEGGMGDLYLARLEGPSGFEKVCVVKRIRSTLLEDQSYLERFVNEAKILASLSHGAIAQVLDMGMVGQEPYLALEYVDGKDCKKIAERQKEIGGLVPPTFVLGVFAKVLEALSYVHRKRDSDDRPLHLVHRDISPQNILVSYEGEVKIIDFGLAKTTSWESGTRPSMVLGKFNYMSPEQADSTTLDHRSDLYSLGVCLYELLAGKNPFSEDRIGLLTDEDRKVLPLSEVMEDCPPRLSSLIAKAMKANPDERFESAEEMRTELLACLWEMDPSAGPHTLSSYLRKRFARDFDSERKLLAAAKKAATKPVMSRFSAASPTGEVGTTEPTVLDERLFEDARSFASDDEASLTILDDDNDGQADTLVVERIPPQATLARSYAHPLPSFIPEDFEPLYRSKPLRWAIGISLGIWGIVLMRSFLPVQEEEKPAMLSVLPLASQELQQKGRTVEAIYAEPVHRQWASAKAQRVWLQSRALYDLLESENCKNAKPLCDDFRKLRRRVYSIDEKEGDLVKACEAWLLRARSFFTPAKP